MHRRIYCKRVGNVWVSADWDEDSGQWRVEVIDTASRAVGEEDREKALRASLDELSSLRQHIWKNELGN